MTGLETIQPFVISFFIGLVIGIERERSHPAGVQAMGVRTFVLIAFLGTLAAWLDETYLKVLISLFAFSGILLSYYRSTDIRQKKIDIGITTEFSAAIVFCLGYLCIRDPFIASFIAVVVLSMLLGRARLHTLARKKIKLKEIQAVTTLLILSLLILPFLPNTAIDPWGYFNPQFWGILILALAIIQFVGYTAIRIFGAKFGIPFMGFFGGMVSSTVVFANLPRLVKENPKLTYPAIAAGLSATAGMLLELIIIIFIASPILLQHILLPVITMFIICIILTLLFMRNHTHKTLLDTSVNPLDLKSVLKLVLLIGSMIIAVSITKNYFDDQAIALIAFLGGLFELHSISLANAGLFEANKLSLEVASNAILIAVLASFISKFALVWIQVRNRFSLLMSLALMVVIAAGFIAYLY